MDRISIAPRTLGVMRAIDEWILVRSEPPARPRWTTSARCTTMPPNHKRRGPTGKPPIRVYWTEANTQDECNPKYWSRLLAKQGPQEVGGPRHVHRYAAHRHVEVPCKLGAHRMVESRLPHEAHGERHGSGVRELICGVSRLCSWKDGRKFAPGDENKSGELRVSMYSTRPAAQNRQRFYVRRASRAQRVCSHSCTPLHFPTCVDVLAPLLTDMNVCQQ